MLFSIKNLRCSYNQGKTDALRISEINIPKGKLVVILGKSGSGKSTILETLGLMNDTIVGGRLEFHTKGKVVDYSNLWSSENSLSEVRNEHMSFIFQNTNLMDNFSAVENACIPQLLQGKPKDEAKLRVKEAMQAIGLGDIEDETSVLALSGGQRQRLAFVRAITPDFTILFGDEPTGNLDKRKSFELMRVIKANLKDHKRSSLIVSHDIDLSIEFADQIIVLTKDEEYGEVLVENIFHADDSKADKNWNRNVNGQDVCLSNIDLKNILFELL